LLFLNEKDLYILVSLNFEGLYSSRGLLINLLFSLNNGLLFNVNEISLDKGLIIIPELRVPRRLSGFFFFSYFHGFVGLFNPIKFILDVSFGISKVF